MRMPPRPVTGRAGHARRAATDVPPPVMFDRAGRGCLMRLLEATPGIEPGYTVLQTVA
jgi:hypothetical protein